MGAMNIPTQAELARLLQGVNVEAVAREANVSTKTIYRYRWCKSAPALDTLERVVAAVQKLQQPAGGKPKRRPAAKVAA
jgi:DNA-binding phage protein